MIEGLLILILLTNPAAQEDAEAFSKKLAAHATQSITIKHGKDANARLAEMIGIGPSDLLAAGAIGKTLTKQKRVILVHLDRRAVNDHNILEAHMWYDGREEKFEMIAGNDGDPLTGLVEGSIGMFGYLLRGDAAANNTVNTSVSLSQLAKEKAWEQLLAKIAGIPIEERAPMVYYYQVMAYVQLNNRDEAVAALNRFRLAYKDHLLVASAESIIPARQHSEAELLNMGGAKTLDPLYEGGSVEIEAIDKGLESPEIKALPADEMSIDGEAKKPDAGVAIDKKPEAAVKTITETKAETKADTVLAPK